MLGSPILYLKGMRIMMFQLSGVHYKAPILRSPQKSPTFGPLRDFSSRCDESSVLFSWIPGGNSRIRGQSESKNADSQILCWGHEC